MTNTSLARKERMMKWLKRIGIGGFLFFLVKGLIWLVIFYWIAR